MILKTAIILTWFLASYLLLLLWASTAWQAALLSVSLGLAMAGIGFNIMHDGGHEGFSSRRGVNRAMALMLDLVGGSSYIWSWKHNVFHHSNPNVDGLDVDIDIQPFCRLSAAQAHRPAHRFQHLYIWLLYALLSVKWHFVDDFKDLITGRIGQSPFPRPRGHRAWSLGIGKALFYGWAVVLPLVLHPWWAFALCFALTSIVLSLALAITFQLAHTVEDAFSGPSIERRTDEPTVEWAVHQIETAVDFAPNNRLLTWYLGGLNFQIEHHLFPRVCHLHLRDISLLVQSVCAEFGVKYRVQPTARAALAAHARWVRKLGTPALFPAAAPVAPLSAE